MVAAGPFLFCLRLVEACVLVGLVGIKRESSGKPAAAATTWVVAGLGMTVGAGWDGHALLACGSERCTLRWSGSLEDAVRMNAAIRDRPETLARGWR